MSSLLSIYIVLLNIYDILTFEDLNCKYLNNNHSIYSCTINTLPTTNLEFDEDKVLSIGLICKNQQSTKITSSKFIGLQHLNSLSIKGCVFDEIQYGAFNGLKELRRVFIHQECNTTMNISDNIFDPTPNLEKIKLNMGIYQMPKEIFCKLNGLHDLNLSGNQLRQIKKIGCGENNTCCSNLLTLDLSHNQLTRVDCDDLSFGKLKDLDLSFNMIGYFSYFDPLSLRVFKISNNKLIQIGQNPFYFPIRLESLDLSFNQLTFSQVVQAANLSNNQNIFKRPVNLDIFIGIKHLNYLQLTCNQIKIFPAEILQYFMYLTVLDLSSNLLEKIECDKCYYLQSLVVLDVMNNSLMEIPQLPSRNLRQLYLNSNKIASSNETIMYTMLEILNLSRNHLQTVPNVKLLRSLEYLDLSFNAIHHINADSFKGLWKLTTLYMIGNGIKTIDDTSLLPLNKLKYLNLESNDLLLIEHIPRYVKELLLQNNNLTTFNFLIIKRITTSINLTNNKLHTIKFDYNTSKRYFNLQHFYASNNQLHDFTSLQLLFKIPTIETIELANNNISRVEWFDDEISKSLEVVDLRNNSITDIFKITLHSSLQLDLRYNPIACTCINDWLLLDNPNVTIDGLCIVTYPRHRRFYSHLDMMSISEHMMLCENDENCPPRCVCFYNFNVDVYIVDCFNVSWKYPLPMLPSNGTTIFFDGNTNLATAVSDLLMNCSVVQTIYMNNSGLVNINKEMFLGVPELIELHLENNCISQINGNEFNFTTELEILYLHQNLLEFLSRNAFQELKKLKNLTLHENRLVQPELWLIFQHGFEITLSRNPFKCDCHFALSFQQWVANSREMKFEDLNETFCSETTTVLLLDFYALKCLDRDKVNEALIIAPTVSISCFFIIVAILIYLYRIEMKVWLYSRYGVRLFHNNKDADIGKEYDAFISYANEDDEWVNEILVPKLNEYKLCLHQRDFPVGEYIVESVVNAVENSCRTVIILTPNYIKSLWCRFEFDTAHTQSLRDKCKRLVVVVLEEVPKDEMDKNLHAYMKTNTYLHINNSLFWSKLKYAMPDVKLRNAEQSDPINQSFELESDQNSS